MQLLESLSDLDKAVQRSHERPIVLFKHSSTCGRSAAALEEVKDLMALEPAADVFVVLVQYGADVSREIAKRFGVRHESPQALIIRGGKMKWHASHFRVTSEEIGAALATSL